MAKKDVNWIIDNYWEYLSSYIASKQSLKDEFKSVGGTAEDFLWNMLQQLLGVFAKAFQEGRIGELQFYLENRNAYAQMMDYMKCHQKKNHIHIQVQYLLEDFKYRQLRYPNLAGYKIFCHGCCDNCNSYNDRIFTPAKAYEHASGLAKICTHPYYLRSSIHYIPIFPDDQDSPIKITLGN